jgi:hypothetical protein
LKENTEFSASSVNEKRLPLSTRGVNWKALSTVGGHCILVTLQNVEAPVPIRFLDSYG